MDTAKCIFSCRLVLKLSIHTFSGINKVKFSPLSYYKKMSCVKSVDHTMQLKSYM